MLDSVLRAAGYHVGLYTSPYLVQFHERIRVDGVMIPDADLTRLSARVAQACEGLTLPEGEHIGEFEFTTALAFLYFAEQRCDIVVLETGLGGRCDATNIILAPEVCVITPISRDHMAVLGDTVAKIAAEKAAIIKPACAVVCAEGQPDEALPVIRRACDAAGAVWYDGMQEMQLLRCDIMGSAFVRGEMCIRDRSHTYQPSGRAAVSASGGFCEGLSYGSFPSRATDTMLSFIPAMLT